MALVWIVAPLAAIAALVVLTVLLREAAAAVRDLGDEIGRFADVRPAVATLRTEVDRSRRAAQRLRRR